MNSADYLRLYFVTDRRLLGGRHLEDVVRRAVQGGVTAVQLREKDISDEEFVAIGRRLKQVLAGTGVPLIINDRVNVAREVDAEGVHIGQSDMDYAEARRILGHEKIIGLSVENMQQVEQANEWDVDYIGISPVFATPTKTDTAEPFGLEGLRKAVEVSRHGTVAIGGINTSNINKVMETGVSGVAAVSAFMDPELKIVKECEGVVKRYARVLTIAGSDSGGGAGIQADIKAISATGSYAASAITAVTVQNTLGVQGVHAVPIATVEAQIEAVMNDIGADAIKIGMLHSEEVVRCVARTLTSLLPATCSLLPSIVLDPVMVSTSGHRLIEETAIDALKKELMPMARVITPNIPEAEVLLGRKIEGKEDMVRAARDLSMGGRISVLMKGGHLKGSSRGVEEAVDYFYNAETDMLRELSSPMVDTMNTHGTGCTLSSAIASYLAQGFGLEEAVVKAKAYIARAIEEGAEYRIGGGHGPVKFFG